MQRDEMLSRALDHEHVGVERTASRDAGRTMFQGFVQPGQGLARCGTRPVRGLDAIDRSPRTETWVKVDCVLRGH